MPRSQPVDKQKVPVARTTNVYPTGGNRSPAKSIERRWRFLFARSGKFATAQLVSDGRPEFDGWNLILSVALNWCECWPWLNAVVGLSCGQNFSPTSLLRSGFFFDE